MYIGAEKSISRSTSPVPPRISSALRLMILVVITGFLVAFVAASAVAALSLQLIHGSH